MPPFFRAALFLAGFALAATPATAGDIAISQAVLNSADGGKVTFKNLSLKDCNLTEAEATSLFTGALSREDAGALLGRMTASEVRIPETVIEAANGDHFTVKDIVAETIAQGGAQSLAIASADGVLPDDAGDSTLHLDALRVEHVSMPGLAAALATTDPGVAAFRFSHLVWQGGGISAVDKATPAGAPGGNRIVLHVGLSTIDQNFTPDGAPLDGSASFTGISLKLPPQSRGGATLAAFGYPELDADFKMAGAYDPARKIYALQTYTIDIQKIGRVGLSGQLSGLDVSAFRSERAVREKAVLASSLDWAQIDVSNAGLFDKIVAAVSLSQGKTPGAVKGEWRAIVAQAPLLFSGAQAVAVVAQELEHFIIDPKTLTLRIKGKDGPLKVSEFAHIADPTAFLNKLDVSGSSAAPGAAETAPGSRL